MKKLICIALLGALLAGCAGTSDETSAHTADTTTQSGETEATFLELPADRQLTAGQYFVYDCEAGAFLAISGEETDRIYPASVTKLFTAYVALQFISPDKTVTAGDALDLVSGGSSVAELEKGDTLTASQLVEAMLLPSGNDAAYVLAAAAGRVLMEDKGAAAHVAVDAFVKEMNRQAKLLGMAGTNFANPDGIHSDSHYTTFADLAVLGMLSMEDPTIMAYTAVSRDAVTLESGEKQWHNTNAIIDPQSQYFCPYATGLKTGQTPRAGSCLLSSFEVQGRTLLIGVFGCPEEDDRFPDTLQLLRQVM